MIDAHQHYWRVARGDYGWLDRAPGAIRRDFLPADLAPILARHGIGRTILVQAAPTVDETRWLLDLARNGSHGEISGGRPLDGVQRQARHQ